MAVPTPARNAAQSPFNAMKEFDTMLSHLFNPPGVTGGRVAPYVTPYGVDVREDVNHLTVVADLPGFKKGEVDITLEDQTLTITADHKPAVETPATEGNGGWLLRERRQARFERRFKLPQTVGDQSVNAKLEDGVLTVTLAKREESKPRRIAVQ